MIRNELFSQVIANLDATVVPLAGQIDAMLAQRVIGVAAALASVQNGDDLNTPPPPLPEGWHPPAGIADSVIADTAYQLGQAATDLASSDAQGVEVERSLELLRSWETALLDEPSSSASADG